MFDNIPEKSKEWLSQQALKYKIPEEELCMRFVEYEQDLRENGLRKDSEDYDSDVTEDQYYEIIKTQVNTYIFSHRDEKSL